MDNDAMFTFMEALLTGNSSQAIENQEKRGQQSVVRNVLLPKRMNDISFPNEIRWNGVTPSMGWEQRNEIVKINNIAYTKQQYEKMGIKIADDYDDLFWKVEMPIGWQIKATDHTMWNNLFDDKGRKRANFFYKAAFYDRDAFINFDTRFSVCVEHTANTEEEYEVWKNSDYQGVVKDGETIIFSTECVAVTGTYDGDDKIKNFLRQNLEHYMQEHYPNYKDINAYWD